MQKIWDKIFLEERPSISLSLFRIAVALTLGSHVIPSLFNLTDNYFHTAYKTYNSNFFPIPVLEWVSQSSDGVVLCFVILFYVFWFCFLIGLFSQISCILMTVCCYYFYALNSFHVGTLSWDILLVTMFLMCITSYHGDYFSIDSLRKGKPGAYSRKRPYFVQRLLQLQIAFTFFYTACYKINPGNWLSENPILYIMNFPPAGVTKWFLIRDFLADKPQLCYAIGLLIVIVELLMPILLFVRKTRLSAIYLGFVFHVTLILTLDVPATFFFLFPIQLLLFIDPGNITKWIENKRNYNLNAGPSWIVYDGKCRFCQDSVRKLQIIDMFSTLQMADFQAVGDVKTLHPDLTAEKVNSQLHLIEHAGTLYGGFHVFRRICFRLPMLYPLIPLLYFPGSGVLGPIIYRWVAKNRYLFHFNKTCKDNSCFR